MTVKEFMRSYRRVSKSPFPWEPDSIISIMRPRIVCNDGFSISVQGSENHYCEPRKNLLDQDYSAVELGFPSAPDDLIADYAEDDEDLCQTVYGWVPINVVEELIEKHGGIKGCDEEQAARMKENCSSYDVCSW